MNKIVSWWRTKERSLEEARQESRAAREKVAEKLNKAKQAGTTIRLSRAALERIAAVDNRT